MAVPSMMYGMNVINWTERDMQKFDVVQSKVGKVALGANGYAAVEAIRGDMSWSTFSERCMKVSIGYKIRIERIQEDICVKKVCEHVGIQSKWLKSCKDAVKKCGLKSGYVDPTNKRGM